MTRWNTLGKRCGMGGGPEIRGGVWVSGSGRLFYWGLSAGPAPVPLQSSD